MATFPKFILDGLTASIPADVSVPDKPTDSVEFDALELTARLPVTVPEACGENVTVKLALWFADKVMGGLMPAKLKPAPVVTI